MAKAKITVSFRTDPPVYKAAKRRAKECDLTLSEWLNVLVRAELTPTNEQKHADPVAV